MQAELAKIWTNILRYATFALPNLLMMDCDRYGANVFEVIDLINHHYPRGGIAMPGLTAGTCLRKDFAFSEERSNAPGMLLAVSRVNEAVPLFLVEGVKRRIGSLDSRKVAVLGLTFKRNTDDERDSLSPKLIRLLERELADVAVCDPHAPTPTQSLADAVQDADVVIVATNHSEFEGPRALQEIVARAGDDCLLVDPWNALGTSQVFVYAAETAGAGAGAGPRAAASARASRDGAGTGHRRRRHDRDGRRAPAAARPALGDPHLRPPRAAAVDARGGRGPHGRPARARATPARPCRAARTSSTWPPSWAASPTSTSCRSR